jgi:VanZ family protein
MLMFLRYWGPVCAYAGGIFYLSSLSHPEDHLLFVSRFSDKVLHAAEYAVLGALCFRALYGTVSVSWRQWATLLAIVLASVYGISDEVHQSFVPFRNSHVLDWVADTVGAALGVVTMRWVLGFWPVRSVPEAMPESRTNPLSS